MPRPTPRSSGALLPALESHTALPTDQSKEVQLDILLAEDNKVNQKLAVRLLENCGHSVEIADNGQIAVDLFKARNQAGHPYDIILVRCRLRCCPPACCADPLDGCLLLQMDVSMPIMGGTEATRLIRETEEGERLVRIPIVALTAHAMLGDREKCLEAGMVRPCHSLMSVLVVGSEADPAPFSARTPSGRVRHQAA